MEAFILDLLMKVPGAAVVLPVAGLLVFVAQALVIITPSKSDDAAWDKLKAVPVLGVVLSLLLNFAPIQKK